jgi:hypothetical protein
MARLTDTQLVILSSASRRNDRGVDLPANVTGEALRKAVDKLIRTGLLEEVRANGSLLAWRRDAETGPMALRITTQGLEAIGVTDVAVGAPTETGVSPAPDRTEVEAPAVKVVAARKRASVATQTTRHRTSKAKTKAGSWRESRLPLQRRRPFARGIARARRRLKLAPRAKAGRGRNKLACSPCWAGRRERRLPPLCARPIGSSIRFAASSLAWCARSSALICARRRSTVTGSIASSTVAVNSPLPAPRVVAQLECHATRGDQSGGVG